MTLITLVFQKSLRFNAVACIANSNNDCENFLQSIRLGKRDKYGSPLFRNLDAFIRTIFKSLLKEK